MATTSSRKHLASPATEQRWRDVLRAWRASGLTADAFSADKAFSAGTLRWWSSRLRDDPVPTFVALRPRAPTVAAPTAHLVVEVGAARVRVADGFDPALLSAVVRSLAEAAR